MLLDNKANGKVVEELRKRTFAGSRLAVLSSLFTIYAFSTLQRELKNLSRGRLLLTDWGTHSLQSLIGSEAEVRLSNQLNQRSVAKECSNWIRKKVNVKACQSSFHSGQNLIHLDQQEAGIQYAVHGSATLTPTGLGEVRSDGLQINTGISDSETTAQLLTWFDGIWDDHIAATDVRDELIEKLDFIASDQPAEFVYFLTLYNIFKDFLEDIDEENIIRSKTGFKDTLVWNKLYKFQKDGVLGAIDKLEKHNGCIIADSVGLGKTFEALAV